QLQIALGLAGVGIAVGPIGVGCVARCNEREQFGLHLNGAAWLPDRLNGEGGVCLLEILEQWLITVEGDLIAPLGQEGKGDGGLIRRPCFARTTAGLWCNRRSTTGQGNGSQTQGGMT